MLTNNLLQNLCDTHKRTVPGISSSALKILMDYSWPGNIRELENTIEYALHLTDEGHPIGLEQLPAKISGNAGSIGERQSLVSIDDYTRQTILSLQSNHAEEDIAHILGISRKSLWEKRKRWEIPRSK